MTHNAHPFQLLEINVVSAQDLAPVSKSMRTYAVVWVHSERKLTTKVDQHGHTNPQWNEKFLFRVDEWFLNAETSAVMIEIYAAAWLRDVQIGSIRVLISNLFPSNNNNSKMHFVALQVRRPSGRPQGIINMGVQILDSTMRSMPLLSELSTSAIGFNDLIDAKTNKQSFDTSKLRRTQSDKTDRTSTEDEFGVKKRGGGGGVGEGTSLVNDGGSLLSSSNVSKYNNKDKDNGNEGNVNGSMVNGSLYSDLGPSASVVAAAIAKGLIKTPANAAPKNAGGAGSSILDDWTENESIEGLRTKLERWRSQQQVTPAYNGEAEKPQLKGSRGSRQHRRRSEGRGLFSCFGNAFGCEISITCGRKSIKKGHGNGKVYHLSSVDSQSYL